MPQPGKLLILGMCYPAPEPKPVSPEVKLRRLFRREASLERQLLAVRREIGLERKRYADKHKLGCFPQIETLRRLFG